MPRIHFMRRKINGEDAVEFFDEHSRRIMTVVDAPPGYEWSPATGVTIYDGNNEPVAVTALTADQVRELGRFCFEQFCELRPPLKTIENAAAYVRAALESWNERARADEEHPPYADLVNRLDEIKHALDELDPLRRWP